MNAKSVSSSPISAKLWIENRFWSISKGAKRLERQLHPPNNSTGPAVKLVVPTKITSQSQPRAAFNREESKPLPLFIRRSDNTAQYGSDVHSVRVNTSLAGIPHPYKISNMSGYPLPDVGQWMSSTAELPQQRHSVLLPCSFNFPAASTSAAVHSALMPQVSAAAQLKPAAEVNKNHRRNTRHKRRRRVRDTKKL